MRTPDLTPAQLVTIAGALLALAAAFGAPIDEEQRAAILGFVAILGSVLLGADAKIRHGRATGKPAPPVKPVTPAEPEPPEK